MKSKTWTVLDVGNVARCSNCGAVSRWIAHTFLPGDHGRPFDYFKWWKQFKQHHARCLAKKAA